jgi:hypothetical protein
MPGAPIQLFDASKAEATAPTQQTAPMREMVSDDVSV